MSWRKPKTAHRYRFDCHHDHHSVLCNHCACEMKNGTSGLPLIGHFRYIFPWGVDSLCAFAASRWRPQTAKTVMMKNHLWLWPLATSRNQQEWPGNREWVRSVSKRCATFQNGITQSIVVLLETFFQTYLAQLSIIFDDYVNFSIHSLSRFPQWQRTSVCRKESRKFMASLGRGRTLPYITNRCLVERNAKGSRAENFFPKISSEICHSFRDAVYYMRNNAGALKECTNG